MWLPTSTARRAAGSVTPPSTFRTSSGYSASGVPDSRWYSASIECVLPPPKFVCRFHHRRGVPVPADPPRRRGEQVPQALGQVGAAEELHRVHVLPRPLAARHLVQVGGELRAAHLPVPHVLVRRDHLPPRLEPVPLNPGDHLHGPPRLGR